MSAFDFRGDLEALDARGLRRRRRIVEGATGVEAVVDGRPLLAFCSNDYLGLAGHPDIASAVADAALAQGTGAGASPLISGHHRLHEDMERRLASFVGLERAIGFSTGYLANLALIPSLVGRGDAVFSDALNHASLIDACRLSRAELQVYPHADVSALASALAASTATKKLVVSDAVFSMDGDLAPAKDLLALCERHDAMLVLDDAHGFGVLGRGGRGSLSHFGIASPRIAYMATLGKAAGVAGAFVAGTADLVEWLLQKARTYIFTTAAPAALAAGVIRSVDLIEAGDERRTHLQALIVRLHEKLRLKRWQLLRSETAIQPLLIGGNVEAVRAGELLLEDGLWVPAIRPPTVPEGTARLRISLSAAHRIEHIDRLADALQRVEAQVHA